MRGHLRKRANGWELRVYVGRDPVTQRKTYVTRTVHGSRRAAEDQLAHLVVQLAGGGHRAQDATVGDLVGQWFQMAQGERSPTTVRQVRAILRRALQQGVRWGWITTNPATLASPPRVTREPVHPPGPEDVRRLIAHAEERGRSAPWGQRAASSQLRGSVSAAYPHSAGSSARPPPSCSVTVPLVPTAEATNGRPAAPYWRSLDADLPRLNWSSVSGPSPTSKAASGRSASPSCHATRSVMASRGPWNLEVACPMMVRRAPSGGAAP